MEASVKLGRIAGIEIGANWSLLIVFALITWSLATGLLPDQLSGYSEGAYLAAGVAGAVLFFASLLAHELGHAIVARSRGVRVEGITLWLFGGVARLSGDTVSAGAEFWLTAVGPLITLVVGGLFAIIALLVGNGAPLVGAMFGWLAGINVLLAVFNLIPAFPLDGGRILHSIIWSVTGNRVRATKIAAWLGRAFGYLMIAAGLFEVIYLRSTLGGIWLAFLGWFLLGAAGSEESQALLRRALRGVRVGDVMTAEPVTAPDWITVQDLIDRFVMSHHFTSYPVRDFDGKLTGLVTLKRIGQVPPEARTTTQVRAIALPLSEVKIAQRSEELVDLLGRLDDPGHRRVLVMDGDRLVGILSPRDISHALDVAGLRREARAVGTS